MVLLELVETVRRALEPRSFSIQVCVNESNAERAWASAPAAEEDLSAPFGVGAWATFSPLFAALAGRADAAITPTATAAAPKKLRGTRAHRVVRRAFIVVPQSPATPEFGCRVASDNESAIARGHLVICITLLGRATKRLRTLDPSRPCGQAALG